MIYVDMAIQKNISYSVAYLRLVMPYIIITEGCDVDLMAEWIKRLPLLPSDRAHIITECQINDEVYMRRVTMRGRSCAIHR